MGDGDLPVKESDIFKQPSISKSELNDGVIKAALDAIDKADRMVDDLCHGAKWTMRVPADEDKDSDLVIGDALHKARQILKAL